MPALGQICDCEVTHIETGIIRLDAGPLGPATLPASEAPSDLSEGQTLSVFLYQDGEGRLLATTRVPKCQVGKFACLKVVGTSDVGAFVDIGLDKDVLLPFGEQHRPVSEGQSVIVTLFLDRRDGRLTASSKIDRFLDEDRPQGFEPRQAVRLLIANSTDLGWRAIIDDRHWGVLYRAEVFQRLSYGQSIRGTIQRIRDDGRIDLSLQGGQESRDKHCLKVLSYLEKSGGQVALHDKSSPEQIKAALGMSKAAFKKAIGALYKQRRIVIESTGIRLISD